MNPSLSGSATSGKYDAFGNLVDSQTGYARGKILSSSVAEIRRLKHAHELVAAWIMDHGPESIANFTGNQRDFPLRSEDLSTIAEEWVGPSLIQENLHRAAIQHLGGQPDDGVAVLNRTSAGIVAAINVHAPNATVVSVVPKSARSHASVIRGCYLARAEFVEVAEDADWIQQIVDCRPLLVVVTTISSNLERMEDDTIAAVVRHAQAEGAVVLLDEAYGARLRTVLHGGRPSLHLGADMSITNTDKGGLAGPRAGVLVGRKDPVTKVIAWASEHGMEARAPIVAAALRSLEEFDPKRLLSEVDGGATLGRELARVLGEVVKLTDLGPMVSEDDIHMIAHDRAGLKPADTGLAPCETATALGMILLANYGILTVNTHGQPGARVSLRLKPTLDALRRAGGVDQVVMAIENGLNVLADHLRSRRDIADLIVGGPPDERKRRD